MITGRIIAIFMDERTEVKSWANYLGGLKVTRWGQLSNQVLQQHPAF